METLSGPHSTYSKQGTDPITEQLNRPAGRRPVLRVHLRRSRAALPAHVESEIGPSPARAEPHDAASRLGRRLSAAGWPTLLDALSAPEESWPAIEAVVGGELESALLWADDDPTGEIGDGKVWVTCTLSHELVALCAPRPVFISVVRLSFRFRTTS